MPSCPHDVRCFQMRCRQPPGGDFSMFPRLKINWFVPIVSWHTPAKQTRRQSRSCISLTSAGMSCHTHSRRRCPIRKIADHGGFTDGICLAQGAVTTSTHSGPRLASAPAHSSVALGSLAGLEGPSLDPETQREYLGGLSRDGACWAAQWAKHSSALTNPRPALVDASLLSYGGLLVATRCWASAAIPIRVVREQSHSHSTCSKTDDA